MAHCKQTSGVFIRLLEAFFYRWGKFVTGHPFPVIICSLVLTLLCGLGLLNLRQEHRAEMLWIPPTSDFITHKNWLNQKFTSTVRFEIVMFDAENVLTPTSIQQMLQLHKNVHNISVFGKTFTDICSKIPIADIFHKKKKRRKRQVEETFNELINEKVSTIGPLNEEVTTNGLENKEVTTNRPVNIETTSTNKTDGLETTIHPEDDAYDDTYYYEDYFTPEWDVDYPVYEDSSLFTASKELTKAVDFDKFGARDDADRKDRWKQTDKLPPQIYCDLVDTLDEVCFQRSILEMWSYDEERIMAASQQEILDAVNLLRFSPWTSYGTDYAGTLGKVVRNSTGHVVAASSAQLIWVINVPRDVEIQNSQGFGFEFDLADRLTLDWEDSFIHEALSLSFPGVSVWPNAVKSFSDTTANAIFFDGVKMAGGFLIMFIYTMSMLGRLNRVEVRMYLAVAGITSVAMGLVIAVGMSSFLGFPYTPVHAMLPFLFLGIGIDDMFVIVQCWTNLQRNPHVAGRSLEERVGLAMKHAGVSVTITSLTDVAAFAVGAVSRMPALVSFCIACAIGLGSIFLLQVSWFVAWMSLDERRIESGRDGIIPCIVHKDYQPPACQQRINGRSFLGSYAKLVSSIIYKVFVIVSTCALLGFGIWGAVHIKLKFKPELLMPSDSYLRRWIDIHNEDFPKNGWTAEIYIGPFDHTQLENLDNLVNGLNEVKDKEIYLKSVNTWWNDLKWYARERKNFTNWQDFNNEKDFRKLLSDFLFSSEGANFKSNFDWDGNLECNKPAPRIEAIKFSVTYLLFDGPDEHIPARAAVEEQIRRANFSSTAFSHTKVYASWETDEIIGFELFRNIGLAMLCVFVVTFILLVNFPICVMVLFCVILTLVDVVGFLHLWGITIDMLSMVNIVLAVGLCVDYSVHIGHAFLIAKGSRTERAVETLSSIGPAVLNGGFTTFLSLVLLSLSTSHIFITFFKVFTLTVAFGLYHGLVFFPILLSLVGPESISRKDPDDSSGTGSTVGSSTVGPTAKMSPSNSGPGSPDRGGHSNVAFVGEVKSEQQPQITEQPWLRNIFSKKASWDVDSAVMY